MLRMAWQLIPAHRTGFISRRGRGTQGSTEKAAASTCRPMQERRGHECLIAIATSTMSPSIHATRKSFTLPGSNPPHGNPAIEVKTGRAYLDLTLSGDIASFPTPKTPKKFTLRHLVEAFGMDPWMEKAVHWTSLRLSFSQDDRTRMTILPTRKR